MDLHDLPAGLPFPRFLQVNRAQQDDVGTTAKNEPSDTHNETALLLLVAYLLQDSKDRQLRSIITSLLLSELL